MTANGSRQPRRPQLQIVAPNAGPDEAAAIAAALEQFLLDTAPAPQPSSEAINPWIRAALLEGVGIEPGTPWGDSQPWR